MKKIVIAVAVIAALGILAKFVLGDHYQHNVRPVIADATQHNTNMNGCVKLALERHPGAVMEVELENEDGKLIFDVDVQGKDGKNWELECDAASGQVNEDKEDK